MKAKDWLKANGHIAEVTRGRISNENHARLAEAAAKGQVFSDWPKGKVTITPAVGEEKATAKVEKSAIAAGDNYGEAFIRYDDWANMIAVADDGTKFSMKEACNNCGLSLLGHQCNSPMVLGKAVSIRRK